MDREIFVVKIFPSMHNNDKNRKANNYFMVCAQTFSEKLTLLFGRMFFLIFILFFTCWISS